MGELELLSMPKPGLARNVRTYVRRLRDQDGEHIVTVVIPEELAGSSLLQFVRRRSLFWLKASLLFEAGIVVTNVPLLPEERSMAEAHAEHPLEPGRSAVLVPISAVHAATARAVAYAASLNAASVEAVFFVTDREEEQRIMRDWVEWEMTVPLSLVSAPFRELTNPMLDEVRRHTSRPGGIVTVVLPELVVARWWQHLLHNQSALFFKRLLIFEPGVVVTSVPFHLAVDPAVRGRR
jgi:hypothetical protein